MKVFILTSCALIIPVLALGSNVESSLLSVSSDGSTVQDTSWKLAETLNSSSIIASTTSFDSTAQSVTTTLATVLKPYTLTTADTTPTVEDDHTSANETSAGEMTVPDGYEYVVYNSDCPCDRSKYRFCTYFRRTSPKPGHCYSISSPCRSIRVHDPLVAVNNPLLCFVYEDTECKDGESEEQAFTDNTWCKQPQGGVHEMLYNSFKCMHRDF